MACVELPKDAYGRSIPLDTGTLYKKNGVAKFIYHYDYDPRDGTVKILSQIDLAVSGPVLF